MNPYLYIPGVPAGGHIARGFWHPGGIGNCQKCHPRCPGSGRRQSREHYKGRDIIGYCSSCEQFVPLTSQNIALPHERRE